jgi:hypothetical protein
MFFYTLTHYRCRFVSLLSKWEKQERQKAEKEHQKFAAKKRRRDWWNENEENVIFIWVPLAALVIVGIALIAFFVFFQIQGLPK